MRTPRVPFCSVGLLEFCSITWDLVLTRHCRYTHISSPIDTIRTDLLTVLHSKGLFTFSYTFPCLRTTYLIHTYLIRPLWSCDLNLPRLQKFVHVISVCVPLICCCVRTLFSVPLIFYRTLFTFTYV